MNRAEAMRHLLWAVGALHEENDDDARKFVKWAIDEMNEKEV